MRSQPGIQMTAGSKPTTEVLCPAGCGEVVLRLSADSAVYPAGSAGASSGLTRRRTGDCRGCGKPFSLAVTGDGR